MFDIGFFELLLIMVVAILVIGPDKLPGLAKTAGLWVGKAQAMVSSVKADIDRELNASNLKNAASGGSDTAEIKETLADLAADAKELAEDVRCSFRLDASGQIQAPQEAEAPDPTEPDNRIKAS